jgi:hypothetical protein
MTACLVTGTADSLDVRNLSRLERAPLPALVVSNSERHESDDSQVLASILLALFSLRFSSPVQELGDVSGLLRDSGHCTILVLHPAIVKRRRHGDSTPGEVRVVVKTRHHFLAGRRLAVSSQESKYVVVTIVARFDHQTQVWRVRTTVGSTSCFLVGVRRRDLVIRLSRTFKHFSDLIRPIKHVDFFRHLLDFFHSVGYTNKLTESNVLERVAGSTNLTVHLESTSEGPMVKRGKVSCVTPRVMWRMDNIFFIEEGDLGSGDCRKGGSTSS